jgi:hypothetical protein
MSATAFTLLLECWKAFPIGDTLATSGTYESNVKDTDSVSSWGKVSWKSGTGDSIEVSTRTGNTGTPDKTWSDWQLPMRAAPFPVRRRGLFNGKPF